MVNRAREAESRAGYTRVFTPNLQEERDERREREPELKPKSFSFASSSEELTLKTLKLL